MLSGETAFRFAEAWARRPTRALRGAHVRALGVRGPPMARSPAVLVGLAFVIVCVVALIAQHLRVERDLALHAGAREVDMRATLLAERLSAALSADPHASEAKVFRSILNAHPDERLAQSMLIDRDGRVVEYDGTQDASDLTTLAGRAKPSAAGDIQGGAVRIQTERGGDQFAAVRVLPGTLTRVAFASPVDGHLVAWRRMALTTALLLTLTVGLMVAAAGLCALKGGDGREQKLVASQQLLLATVAELKQSRRSLEEQAQQLAELAELYHEQKSRAEVANRAKTNSSPI